MNALKNIIGYRTLKTAVGAIIAILIAEALGLDYAANAGIIVILSVQASKKRSMDLAIMRIGSTFLALGIGTLVFSLMGFTALAFGIYLLIFIPIAVKLKFNDGIVPCSVLVTHLLAIQSVALPALVNELLQMLIGAGIGYVLNLYMPNMEKMLDENSTAIDACFKSILFNMSKWLRDPNVAFEEPIYQKTEKLLKEGYERAWRDYENRLSHDMTYHVKFIEARIVQFEILKHMKKYLKRIHAHYEHTGLVADLTEFIAHEFEGLYTSEDIFSSIEAFRKAAKKMSLPQSRDEFENRATLYEFVNDLEHFLVSNGAIIETLNE